MGDIAFRCTCGTVTGHLIGAESGASGSRLACYCNSCRSAELALGQPDPKPEPMPLFQTTPDRVVFDTGADRLAVMRLGPKSNTYRWYATCCDAPLAITGPSPKFPFVSFNLRRVADPDALGKVSSKVFVPQPGGGTKHTNVARFVYGIASRSIAARLSGRWKQTPFFDVATGTPNGPVRVLSSDERAALPLKG
ncbi:DUF6151 family protein [Flavimaricola marinus]|uniref:CENP-V/GFA domain-containing protein n=1 Tax=Flavimaricola marinus TaxID=1819565 RepID=A0A238LKK5_9RHOB|nr:DUF6151 family protein [Flavimaricola marinus]SMY09486.1 hypothetical protein LOM8899_03653 [Flavimaricola marinus]